MQPLPLLQELGRPRRLCLRPCPFGRPCVPSVHRFVAARTASIPTKEEVPDKVPSADVIQLLNNAAAVSSRDHAEIAAALESVYNGVPSVVPWHEVPATIPGGAQLDGKFGRLNGHSNGHATASSSGSSSAIGSGAYLNGHANGATVNGGHTDGCSNGHPNGARLNGSCPTCHPSEAHASAHANGLHVNGHSDAHHTVNGHATSHQASSSREDLGGQRLMLDPRVHLQVVLPPGIMPDALNGHSFSGRQGGVNGSSSSSSSSSGAQASLTVAPPAAAPPPPQQQQQQLNGHATETQAGLTLPLLAPSLDDAASGTGEDHSSSGSWSSSSSSSTEPTSQAAVAAATDEAEVEPPPGTIPQSILILSIISASLTLASCVFNTALPIYMVTELKMSMRSMGMFEGLLEAFSYIVRMFSGVVSDAMTSRKAAITLGFAMGAAAKFGMSCSGAVTQLFAFKAMDRLANGVQAAPRDALIGDLSPASSRSACFGFAQSMRKWGSSIGALMCYFLMRASKNNYQVVFTTAASISLASCIAFVLLVPAHPRVKAKAPAAAGGAAGKAEQQQQQQQQQQAGFSLGKFMADVRSLGNDFYRMVATISLYALGHLNESLLEARCIEVGFGKAESTLVVCALAAVTFLCAYPLGRVDDEHGPQVTFAIGMGALIMGNLILLTSSVFPMAVFVSCVFLGLHYAILQGPILSSVVRLSPPHLRGTAFGVFYTVMALTAVVANTIFGTVWHAYSAQHAFALSAAMTTCTLMVLPKLLPKQAAQPPQQQRMAMAAA